MQGKIDAAATISLPIANESCNTINIPSGSGDLETFIKESLLMCFEQCNVGDNLVITPITFSNNLFLHDWIFSYKLLMSVIFKYDNTEVELS